MCIPRCVFDAGLLATRAGTGVIPSFARLLVRAPCKRRVAARSHTMLPLPACGERAGVRGMAWRERWRMRQSPAMERPSHARAPAPAHAHRRVSPYLLLTLTPLFWSVNWIVGRGLHHEIPPMAMTFFRWLFAIAILAPFALRHVRRDWAVISRHWRTMLGLGALGIGLHNALAYLGLNYTTATNGVILNSFIPVMIVTIAWVFLRERLAPWQIAGLAISLAGVLAILSQGSLETLAAFRLNGGDLLVILSMAMWSTYTVALRWRPSGLHPLSFLFVLAVIGDACVLPLWLGEMALGHRPDWTLEAFAAFVAVALFSSVLAYIFWNRGVEQVGASVAGLFVHLMPVFGVLLAWVFLGETLGWHHVAGIALILAGIWVTSRTARKAA